MKKITLLIASTLLITWMPHPLFADKGSSDKINWASYASAQSRNDDSRKYFIYFYSEQCGYCNMLEKKTFSDKAVIEYINSNYTPIKVNAGKDFKLASKFGIQGVPDLRFLTPEGDGIARWPGFIETKRLLPLLQYIHSDSYESISYKDFLKQKKGR
jgi:thioredoxin-related protein